jgi:FKBP-type peptidyl-prolyl cis-trans isomerase FklB
MKARLLLSFFLMSGIILSSFGQKAKAPEKPIKLATKIDTISYCIGTLFGGNLAQANLTNLNASLLTAGIADMLNKKTPAIDAAKANELVNAFVMNLQKGKAEKNLKDGKAFLEKNKTEQGVVSLPSGLQYKIIKDAAGAKPLASDKVTVHYQGSLLDGKVFDSSIEKGQPIQLKLDGVIKGWTEALQLMSVGSKWRLFIPSELAYGENAPGGVIEPNMTLIFEVELISIDKDQPAEQPAEQQPQIQAQPQNIIK